MEAALAAAAAHPRSLEARALCFLLAEALEESEPERHLAAGLSAGAALAEWSLGALSAPERRRLLRRPELGVEVLLRGEGTWAELVLFDARLDALAEGGTWEEVLAELEHPSLRARCLWDSRLRTIALERAVVLAWIDPQRAESLYRVFGREALSEDGPETDYARRATTAGAFGAWSEAAAKSPLGPDLVELLRLHSVWEPEALGRVAARVGRAAREQPREWLRLVALAPQPLLQQLFLELLAVSAKLERGPQGEPSGQPHLSPINTVIGVDPGHCGSLALLLGWLGFSCGGFGNWGLYFLVPCLVLLYFLMRLVRWLSASTYGAVVRPALADIIARKRADPRSLRREIARERKKLDNLDTYEDEIEADLVLAALHCAVWLDPSPE